MYAPVKLMVRQKPEEGWIYAYIALADESEKTELSRLDIRIAQEDRQAFDEWVDACSKIMKRWTERISGLVVSHMQTIRPHEGN